MKRKNTSYNKEYFKKNGYKGINLNRKFTRYWWSCRFYSLLIKRHCPKGKLLDIGCGLGHLDKMLEKDYEIVGIDINESAIREARKICTHGLFKNIGAEDIDCFPNEYFQIVVMRHLLEHLSDPFFILKKAKDIIGKDGYLVIATPNPGNLFAKRMGNNWVGYLDPTHISIKSPNDWISFLKNNGFRIKHAISDGFWAGPYIRIVPVFLQKIIFGLPGGVQAVLGINFLPPVMGESLIIIAQKN